MHRLAELQGFRWFSLLRRIDAEYTDYKAEGAFGNYVSLTVWEDKVYGLYIALTCRICTLFYYSLKALHHLL
jgi:hypothetical protein